MIIVIKIDMKRVGRPPTETELESLGYDDIAEYYRDLIQLNAQNSLREAVITVEDDE